LFYERIPKDARRYLLHSKEERIAAVLKENAFTGQMPIWHETAHWVHSVMPIKAFPAKVRSGFAWDNA